MFLWGLFLASKAGVSPSSPLHFEAVDLFIKHLELVEVAQWIIANGDWVTVRELTNWGFAHSCSFEKKKN